jgi:hypothetical protein
MTWQGLIKERHDSLEFLNHVYLQHNVRLIVAVDRLARPASTDAELAATIPEASSMASLKTWYGRVVVPLSALDRHSRATTHVTNEAGEIVPLFTSNELNRLLGGGLVSYAERALGAPVPGALSSVLRDAPREASGGLEPAGVSAQTAADRAFESARDKILNCDAAGVEILRSLEFRTALRLCTGSEQLVVALDLSKGPVRALSYSFNRPLLLDEHDDEPPPLYSLRRYGRDLSRFWSKAGTTTMTVALGQIGACDRYRLDASAPFDTWFAGAQLMTGSVAQSTEVEVDTSQRFRLSHSVPTKVSDWAAALRIDLRLVFTGVTRSSVYASLILAIACLGGLARVAFADDHLFLASDLDAGASVLLLFPGIAASLLATPTSHTLTATVQFPMRLALWSMGFMSFVLAAATALRLSGLANVLVWSLVTAYVWFIAIALRRRRRDVVAP